LVHVHRRKEKPPQTPQRIVTAFPLSWLNQYANRAALVFNKPQAFHVSQNGLSCFRVGMEMAAKTRNEKNVFGLFRSMIPDEPLAKIK